MRRASLALLLCTLAVPAQGQVPATLALGQRVWVRWGTVRGHPDRGVKGTLEAITRDSLLIRPTRGSAPVSVAVTDQLEVFVSTSRRSAAGRGALIGGGIGVATGVVAGLVAASVTEGDWFEIDPGPGVAAGVVFFGGVGVLTGLVIGAVTRHDVWAPAGGNMSMRPALEIGRGSVRLGARLTF